MTEVPEHLLRRAKERRAAMTGESAGEGDAPATGAAASTAVEPAAGAAPAPAAGGGGAPAVPAAPVAPPYTGPPPSKPRKQRVPVWAGAALAVLPLWAILYGGAFGERAATGESGDPVPFGATVYVAQGCGGCHGPTGGGGVGPAFDAVVETFPEFADHVTWIREGSAALRGQTYGATNRPATGGMPGFPDLTDEEVIAVVCHERVTLGGAEIPPECEPGAEVDAGGGTSGGGGEGDADSATAGN